MPTGRPPAPGHNVKLPALLHAECTVMAAEMGLANVGQWVERAVRNQLAADREAAKVHRYQADRRAAEQNRHRSMPYASDYGLPPDFDLPSIAPSAPVLAPFRR